MIFEGMVMMAPLFMGLGVLSGFLAGLLGVGGGIVLVPGLFFLFSQLGYAPEHLMHMAVGTSLAIIIPTGFSSARSHWKRGAVNFVLLRRLAPWILLGVGFGTLIANAISGDAMHMIFAAMLIFLAALMNLDPSRFSFSPRALEQPWSGIMGAVIGVLSTLMGIGGATVSVPYMTLGRTPIREAIGTASALGPVISIPAAIGFVIIGFMAAPGTLPPFSLGYINFAAWVFIVPFSVLVAPLGARVAHRVPVKTLRMIFSVFLMIVALRMLYGMVHG